MGGVLVTYVGYTLTFLIDGATYMVSALLLLGLPKALPRMGPVPRLLPLIAEAPRVLGRLWVQPGLRVNLLLATFASAAVMMSVPNSYGLALDVFDRGAAGTGGPGSTDGLRPYRGRARLQPDVVAGRQEPLCGLFPGRHGTLSGGGELQQSLLPFRRTNGPGRDGERRHLVPSITMFQQTPSAEDKGRLIAVRSGFGQMGITAGFLLGGVLGATLGSHSSSW